MARATTRTVRKAVQEYREYYRFFYRECMELPQAKRQPYADTLSRLKAAAYAEMECQKAGQ